MAHRAGRQRTAALMHHVCAQCDPLGDCDCAACGLPWIACCARPRERPGERALLDSGHAALPAWTSIFIGDGLHLLSRMTRDLCVGKPASGVLTTPCPPAVPSLHTHTGKCNVNLLDFDKASPLHLALEANDLPLVELLLGAGGLTHMRYAGWHRRAGGRYGTTGRDGRETVHANSHPSKRKA